MRPFISNEELGMQHAVLAENIDFYSRSLVPFRKPSHLEDLVDFHGRAFEGEAAGVMKVGKYFVGLPAELHNVPDPNGRGVLFVQDRKLWRITDTLIRLGYGPSLVGVPIPDEAPALTVLTGAGCKSEWPHHECAPEGCDDPHAQPGHMRSYRITFLNDCNEEGPPSAPAEPVSAHNGDAVAITRADTNAAHATAWRIYRSVVTTDAKVVWLHVADRPISERAFIDRLCPHELGEALNTEAASPPPECLDGIALAHNNRVAVWSGSDFWVSRCDSPAIYPNKMHTRLPDRIVFMAGYTTIAEQDTHFEISAVTERYPYAVEIEDDFPRIREIPEWIPALDPFAWGVFRGGVVYSSTEGIAHLIQGQVKYITDQYFTRREWAKYDPPNARYTQWGERLFVWVNKGSERRGLLFGFGINRDIREGDMTEITIAGKMAISYVNRVEILVGNSMYLWEGSSQPMLMRWRSHENTQTGWTFPTSIKVEGEIPRKDRGLMSVRREFDRWLKRNQGQQPEAFFDENCKYERYRNRILNKHLGSQITVYLDNDVLYSREVLSNAPMRLPRRNYGKVWAFELTSYRVIHEVHLQNSSYDMVQEGGHA